MPLVSPCRPALPPGCSVVANPIRSPASRARLLLPVPLKSRVHHVPHHHPSSRRLLSTKSRIYSLLGLDKKPPPSPPRWHDFFLPNAPYHEYDVQPPTKPTDDFFLMSAQEYYRALAAERERLTSAIQPPPPSIPGLSGLRGDAEPYEPPAPDRRASTPPSTGDGAPPPEAPAVVAKPQPPPKEAKYLPPSAIKRKDKKAKATAKEPARPVPSPASGGVPQPTAAYLAQAARPPGRLPAPRRILVVLDLNGTLLHRPDRRRAAHFVERPHAATFLRYCLDTFKVAVWSSARPKNVEAMLAQLLTPAQRARLVVAWGRDMLGLSAADYNTRVQCYKRLERLWAEPAVRASHPEAEAAAAAAEATAATMAMANASSGVDSGAGHWDQSNTIIVDDSFEKGRAQPHNMLVLPEFAGDTAEPGFVLPQVHNYLNECAYQTDISAYMRAHPFRLDDNFTLRPR